MESELGEVVECARMLVRMWGVRGLESREERRGRDGEGVLGGYTIGLCAA